MPVTSDKPAPYAPASTILDVINRYRSKGLPAPITRDVLVRAGIAETLTPRVLQSLETFDLIDADGKPTHTFDAIRKAPEAEYKQRVAEWLNAAYADALNFVDPAMATEVQVRDAFRGYVPIGQQDRMVSLFMGLYAHAGVRPEKPERPAQGRLQPTRRIVNPLPRQAARAAIERKDAALTISSHGIPQPLLGLLSRLPSERGWTQADRDKFISTFSTVLDFCFPIVTPKDLRDEHDEGLA